MASCTASQSLLWWEKVHEGASQVVKECERKEEEEEEEE